MTDNDIKKALECCVNWNGITSCRDCPFNDTGCIRFDKSQAALDLINRYEAEKTELLGKIEDLEANRIKLLEKMEQLEDMVTQNEGVLPKYENYIKAEAIKEFAERVCEDRVSNDPVVIAVKCELNEMVGESE